MEQEERQAVVDARQFLSNAQKDAAGMVHSPEAIYLRGLTLALNKLLSIPLNEE